MIKEKTVTVVIPCYNEGVRVWNVLKAVKRSKLVTEIIVVDDSSDDQTREMLNKVSGIKLITHPKNLGKSQAMKTGVLNAKSDVIVFIDADLSNFKGYYVDELVKPVINGKLDLVLGDRENEFWLSKLLGLSVVLTGERAMEKKLLLDNIKIFDHGGYLAEVAMNKIFFKNKKIGRVFLKGVGQVLKYKKYGFVGCLSDLNFFIKVIKMVGFKELVKQILFVKSVKKINY